MGKSVNVKPQQSIAKQKPCAYFLGYTVCVVVYLMAVTWQHVVYNCSFNIAQPGVNLLVVNEMVPLSGRASVIYRVTGCRRCQYPLVPLKFHSCLQSQNNMKWSCALTAVITSRVLITNGLHNWLNYGAIATRRTDWWHPELCFLTYSIYNAINQYTQYIKSIFIGKHHACVLPILRKH